MNGTTHFVCLACGFIVEGNQPPDKCPICGAPKRAFYPRHKIPSAPSLKTVSQAKAKPAPQKGKNHWVCLACGHIHEGNQPPDKCPICHAPKSVFRPRQYF